jgi:hypothetical protein
MFFQCRFLNSPYHHQDANHLVDNEQQQQQQQQNKAIPKEGPSPYPPFYPYSQHPSQIWWHQQRYQKHLKKKELKDAWDVSDLIRQRFHLQSEGHYDNQILPVGFGYGVLVGGMTFMAVGISLSMISRVPYIKNTFSPRAIHIGSKSITLLATLGTTSRYVHNEQTRHNLKKIGTYIAPTEPNHNADMLCRHPMIINAIEEQRKRNEAYYNQERHPHFHGDINDYWWWSKTVQEQEILDEYHNVLRHCEQRLQLASNNMNDRTTLEVAKTKNGIGGGFRKGLSW